MRGKVGIIVVVAAVAVLAFVVGSKFRGPSTPDEESVVSEPFTPMEEPAAIEEAPPAPPPPPAPRRPRQPATPSAARPAAPAASPAAPAEPAAPTGVRRVAPTELRVAEGTKVFFTLNKTLSTKTSQAGDSFSGVVSRAVRVGDKVAIPEGSLVRGIVAQVERAGRVKGRAELGLRFEQIELPDGETLELRASLSNLGEAEKETVTEEGQVKGEGTKARDAITIGGGAGVGTAIGAIAGGGKGAAIGAGTGAAAGTAVVLLTRGKDIELKRGSELTLQLDRALTVHAK